MGVLSGYGKSGDPDGWMDLAVVCEIPMYTTDLVSSCKIKKSQRPRLAGGRDSDGGRGGGLGLHKRPTTPSAARSITVQS